MIGSATCYRSRADGASLNAIHDGECRFGGPIGREFGGMLAAPGGAANRTGQACAALSETVDPIQAVIAGPATAIVCSAACGAGPVALEAARGGSDAGEGFRGLAATAPFAIRFVPAV
jgi:hypothetical protein